MRARRVGICFGLGFLVLIVLGAIVLSSTVDNWERDLTTNYARTIEKERNPRLRPIKTNKLIPDVVEIVVAAAKGLPNWELVEKSPDDREYRLHFVRTTRLWRFRDDVRVRLIPTPDGTYLTAESQSRIGRGDLGQNPRNLVELLDKLRPQLE
jgi:uncharacterized protein (DUF1499 family)